MKISVVIPTYNEEDGIEHCLNSILSNTYQAHEILVCDGRSTDKTCEIAVQMGAVVLDNEKRIASAGRNVGINRATGDIIAFTDGDCFTDKFWLEKINEAFESDADLVGIGGKVIPAEPRNDVEAFWGNLSLRVIMSFGDVAYEVKERTLNDAFITANCAYKRTNLIELGGFDDWFGNNAEDVDLSWRMLKAGHKLRYIPEPIIFARSPTTMKGVKKKSFRNGVSSTKLQKRWSGRKWCFDANIHKMRFKSFFKMLAFNKNAYRSFVSLSSHFHGKLYASIKYKYWNL